MSNKERIINDISDINKNLLRCTKKEKYFLLKRKDLLIYKYKLCTG